MWRFEPELGLRYQKYGGRNLFGEILGGKVGNDDGLNGVREWNRGDRVYWDGQQIFLSTDVEKHERRYRVNHSLNTTTFLYSCYSPSLPFKKYLHACFKLQKHTKIKCYTNN